MIEITNFKKHLLLLSLLLSLFVSSFAYADSVRILDNARDALSLRYELIKKAKSQILISYFIFAEDETSMEILALLREKSREGVDVKIIVDALFNSIPRYVGTHLTQSGIQIKNFNKFNIFRFGRSIKNRMHDKMLVVDGEEIILGGRNIEDTYYDRADKNYTDRDVYVAGNTAKMASEYYLELWQAKHLTNFKLAKPKIKRAKKHAKYLKQLEEAVEIIDNAQSKYLNKKMIFSFAHWTSKAIEVDSVELAHDEISSVKNSKVGTTQKLYELLKNAKHTVIIDSPYLIMTRKLKNIFKKLISENVKIRILTNSLKSTDGLFPAAGYLNQRRKIAKMGIELYEYNSKDSFHSKSFVIDNEVAIIGSFNLDPRSQNLNTETLAIIRDERVAKRLTESMDATLDSAYLIDKRGRPVGFSKRLPGVNLRKKIITRLYQIFITPWARGLL